MRNLIILILITVLVGISFLFNVNSSANFEARIDSGYQTLSGQLYREGSAEVSNLIFKSAKEAYLVINPEGLETLSGLPVLLTGHLSRREGKGPYQGEIEITHYNTDYDRSKEVIKEASVLGDLVAEDNNLVLLTPEQMVIRLDPTTYHSLADYLGQEVVINGSLSKKGEYQAWMEVKSYRIID